MTHSRNSFLTQTFASLVVTAVLAASFLTSESQAQATSSVESPTYEYGEVRRDYIKAELLSDVSTIAPGETFHVGVLFKMDPKWHVYWKNPGDAGKPTEINWTLPEGFKVGALKWPAPERYDIEGVLVNYGYEGDLLLMAEVTAPKNLKLGEQLTLRAYADWLVCEEECVPGNAHLALDIQSGEKTELSKRDLLFAKVEGLLPINKTDAMIEASWNGNEILLQVSDPQATGDALFYSSDPNLVDHLKAQKIYRKDSSIYLSISRSNLEPTSPKRLQGVYISSMSGLKDPARQATVNRWIIDAPMMRDVFALPEGATLIKSVDTNSSKEGSSKAKAEEKATPSLFTMLALAFLGGLILNLMPCVFPVIGLKIMNFVQQAGEDPKKIIIHGLIFTLGVLVSFWMLAGVLVFLRSAGHELGWGFQLQSPIFVFFMTIVLLVFGLSLSGVFEFGASAIGLGSKLTEGEGMLGSFGSGVVATLVSTPCAAPFLAPALAYALSVPPLESFLLFTVIGIGLSSPYLIFSFRPQLLSALPRPGAWMESFKQFMAFPMYATTAYLIWVLAGQVEDETFLNLLLGLLLVAMGCWIFGRWTTPAHSERVQQIALPVSLIVLGLGVFLGWPSQSTSIQWEKWSPQRVEELREANTPVYIDFTARWCATCQVNKRTVFSSSKVLNFFNEKGVVALKADWTNADPIITKALDGYGKKAVPVNVIYLPESQEAVLLPEVLTPDTVLDALKDLR